MSGRNGHLSSCLVFLFIFNANRKPAMVLIWNIENVPGHIIMPNQINYIFLCFFLSSYHPCTFALLHHLHAQILAHLYSKENRV